VATDNKTFPIIINSFIGTTGLGFPAVLPLLVGAIVDTLGFERAMVGWIASTNIFGIALGGLIATLLIGKVSLVKIVRVGLIGLLILDVCSAFVLQAIPMLGIRFVSGIFGGLAYAGSLAAFSGLKNPIKAYGIYVVVYCVWSGIVLMTLPLLIQQFGLMGGFGVLVFMAFVSLLGSGAIPKLAANLKEKEMISLSTLLSQKEVLLALLGYFALQMGGGTIWAYVERIAKEAGLESTLIGQIMGASTILAIFGGLWVFKVGDSKGIKIPLLTGVFIMGLGAFLLFWASLPIVYFLAISLFGGAWSIAIPFYQQIQAKFDPTGKVVTLGTIVNTMGRATGPGMAALFLGANSYSNVIWLALGALSLSILILLPLLWKS